MILWHSGVLRPFLVRDIKWEDCTDQPERMHCELYYGRAVY